jgi:phage N-6-adenine-methyltransferase
MGKQSAGSGLSKQLRAHRRSARLTQAELAKKCGLAERTLRALEQGSGTLRTWQVVVDALGLNIVGRNLPGGEILGQRIATLRRRRRLSQSALAEMVGVTKPTIGALERIGTGRLATLQAVLDSLGAGAYLAAKGTAPDFYTHAGNSSVDHCWQTPQELLEALYKVFRFDLDPCAATKTRQGVKARVRYTAEDDGLNLPWHGVVFMNPPYGRTLGDWVAKGRHEHESGRAHVVVALLPARPDTRYWHEHIAGKATVYFLKGRLKFGGGEQSAPFPSALVIWGEIRPTIAFLDEVLPEAWRAG